MKLVNMNTFSKEQIYSTSTTEYIFFCILIPDLGSHFQ